jgi:hypothetical protein
MQCKCKNANLLRLKMSFCVQHVFLIDRFGDGLSVSIELVDFFDFSFPPINRVVGERYRVCACVEIEKGDMVLSPGPSMLVRECCRLSDQHLLFPLLQQWHQRFQSPLTPLTAKNHRACSRR